VLDNAYVAGLFDGEGCIHVQKNCQMKVYLTQKDPEILYLLKKQYGGRVYTKQDGNENYTAQWQLCPKKDMESFLKAIQPHSIIKRSQIELALQMFPLYRKPGRAQAERTPPEMWFKRETLRDAIKQLK